jgi:hypothetical protein
MTGITFGSKNRPNVAGKIRNFNIGTQHPPHQRQADHRPSEDIGRKKYRLHAPTLPRNASTVKLRIQYPARNSPQVSEPTHPVTNLPSSTQFNLKKSKKKRRNPLFIEFIPSKKII